MPKPAGFFTKGRGKKRKVIPISKRKLLPRRIIKPMLAEKGEQSDISLHSFAEQRKYDGTRCLIIKEGKTVLLVGARTWKSDYAPNFPEIVKEVKKLPVHSCIIDSELTFFKRGTDKDVFLTALAGSETKKGFDAKCMVFDVLYIDGEDVEDEPFPNRMKLLDTIIPNNLEHIREVETVEGREKKVEFFKDLASRQGEGVVLKDIRSPYREGARTREWLKVKNWKSDEAVVVGYTQGKGERAKTFGSLILAQRNKNGRWVYVGKTSGFTEAQMLDLLAKMKKLKRNKTAIVEGKIPEAKAWVKPKIVVEVKYYERTSNGIFRFPAFMRQRHDKKPGECVT